MASEAIDLVYGSGSFTGHEITNLNYSIGGLPASMTVLGIVAQSKMLGCNNLNQGIFGMAYLDLSKGVFILFIPIFSRDLSFSLRQSCRIPSR